MSNVETILSERRDERTALPNSYYRRDYSTVPSGYTYDGGGSSGMFLSMLDVKTQEVWDGDTLSVRLLDSYGDETGSTIDATVTVGGSGSRPFVDSGDIVKAYYDADGTLQVYLEPAQDNVGSLKIVHSTVDILFPQTDDASTQEADRNEWMWWRACDGGTCHISNGDLTGYDDSAVPDLRQKVIAGYDANDADNEYDTVGDGGGSDSATLVSHGDETDGHTHTVETTKTDAIGEQVTGLTTVTNVTGNTMNHTFNETSDNTVDVRDPWITEVILIKVI